MATQINWKDLEDRLQKAGSNIQNQVSGGPQNNNVPVYICWPSENNQSSSKDNSILKMVFVMMGVLFGGLVLGILMARFMLPW